MMTHNPRGIFGYALAYKLRLSALLTERCFKVAWSLITNTSDSMRHDLNFSNLKSATKNSFSVKA